MKKTWTITLNGTPISGGTIESWVLKCWKCTCAYVAKNGGYAELISGKTMVIEKFGKEVSNG